MSSIHKIAQQSAHSAPLTWLQVVHHHQRQITKTVPQKNPLLTMVRDLGDKVTFSSTGGDNTISFNLPSPSESLVTIYDLAGKILTIQQFSSHKNTEKLASFSRAGNFVVRVLVKENGGFSQNSESFLKIIHSGGR